MAARYNKQFDECLEKFLSQKNYFTNVLELIEVKTNVKRVYVFKGENSSLRNVMNCELLLSWP